MSITRKVQRRTELRKAKRHMVPRHEVLAHLATVHPRAPAPLPPDADNDTIMQAMIDERKARNAAKRERRRAR